MGPCRTQASLCGRAPQPGQNFAWTDDGLVCADCRPLAQKEKPTFTGGELALLSQVAARDVEGVVSLFAGSRQLEDRRGVFVLASRCAEGVLHSEK